MRSLVNRKVNREPVRSPSPDIANRNIIVHTTAPQFKEILSKSRTQMKQSSKNVLPYREDIEDELIDSHEKYRELERQLTALLVQNSAFKKQNLQLRDLLAKSKSGFIKPFDQPKQQVYLKDYQTRINRFSEEIKRIQELLRREKQKNQQLQSQILKVKKQEPRNFNRYPKNAYHEQAPSHALRFIEESLNENFEKLKVQYELKLHLSLHALNQRLIKIEKNQSSIQSIVNRSEYQTPKTHKQGEKHEYSTAGGYLSGSAEIKKFSRSGRHLEDERQIDMLKDKLRLNQLEFQSAKKDIEKLNYQLNRQKERSLVIADCAKCRVYLIKIADLQKEIENLKLSKEKVNKEGKIIDLIQMDVQFNELKKTNEFYIKKIENLQKQNQLLTQIKQQEIQRQAKLKNDKDKKLTNLTLSLQDYLERIKQLKNILSSQEFKDFLLKIKGLIDQNNNLRTRVERLEEASQKFKELKGRQLQLRLQVSDLKRQNEVLKIEKKEMQQQIIQLKQIIDQHIRQPQSERNSLLDQPEGSKYAQPDVIRFQSYLSEAMQRLQSMEISINNQINETVT